MANNLHEPLYLAHRPQKLAELVGQSTVVTTLSNAIAHNRLSHAYLFTGPRGTGKTSTARILAKSLNCESGPTADPCLQCTSCQEIAKSISPAVFEIDAASNNSVDDARILIERAPLVVVGGRFKLYIIDECHMLTKEAFNALLKTIEEPPDNVVFILATTEEHKVLPTIVSRCQKLMFRLVSQEDLKPHLKNVAALAHIEIEDAALDLIARRCGGGLRDALGLLDQASLLCQPGQAVSSDNLLTLLGAISEDALCQMSRHILQRNGQELLSTVNQLLQQGREPALIAQELSRHFLNLAKAFYLSEATSTSPEAQALISGSQTYLDDLQKQASLFERPEITQMVEALDKLESVLRRSSQPAMHLEMGLLGLCHRQDILLISQLSARVEALEAKLAQAAHLPPLPAAAAPQTAAPAAPDKAPALSPPSAAVTPIAPPAAVAATPAGSAAPLTPLEDTSSSEDLEEFWSSLIDTLADRHRPTWSLVSMHAFAVSLNQKELTIGVLKANFQKMIEGKSDHLKQACESLLGRSIIIKVKVFSQAPTKTASAPAAQPKPAGLDRPLSDDDNTPQVELPPPVVAKPAAGFTHDHDDNSYLVKEAYQLFDGPGSRQIG